MNKIKELRKQNGMSLKKLSDETSVPYRTMQDWESGKRKPRDVYQLYKVAKVLHVAIEDLINIESEEER